MQFVLQLLVIFVLLCHDQAWAGRTATPSMMGALGLNTVPSARMDKSGTARINVAALDPYLHASTGIQIADPLYINIRQSAEISDLNGNADRLYPGVDLRLRLKKETGYIPEITLGLQSAIGHKRMAAEYLVLSKRYKDIDFTGGIAWGRLGSAAHIENPLKLVNNHFGKRRLLNGNEPNEPNNWFTGEDAGFFAGIEYYSPHIKGLSFKADWGADRYIIEQTQNDYSAPAPWSVGVNYEPADWINFGTALVGGEKILGQINLRAPVNNWFAKAYKEEKPHYLRPYRTGLTLPKEMEVAAARDNIRLYETRRDHYNVETKLLLDPFRATPMQIGRGARHLANHAGEVIEGLRITPQSYGLLGTAITIQRRDLEMALARKQGSPQEIWRNATFENSCDSKSIFYNLTHDRFNAFDVHRLRFILDNQISLSEEDSGLLYRTGLILEETRKLSEHFWIGGALRLDVTDNTARIRDFRPRSILPVRNDIDDFAKRTLSLDRSFITWMTTIKPDLHVSLTAGYLEEMYAGAGGEILYRPFGKRFAIGLEAYQVFKRDPFTDLNLGLNGDHLLSGHLQAWYEIPDTDLTLQARVGRYLAEDVGGTLALHKNFNNGARLEAFVTATGFADFDVFGSRTHLYSGLKLALPFGQIKHAPEGSEIRISAAPLGRDAGQSIDAPIKLYEISEPLSMRHIEQHWTTITE